MLRVLGAKKDAGASRHLVTRHSLRETRKRLRILLAEDNAINREVAVRMLSKRGHKVVVAGNGKEAVEAFESQSFDMILMDVQMPEMDGFEATAVIRRKEKAKGTQIPIIAMTAHAMKGDRERCMNAGMDDYISKPIAIDELIKVTEGRLNGPHKPMGKADSSEVFDRAGARRVDNDEAFAFRPGQDVLCGNAQKTFRRSRFFGKKGRGWPAASFPFVERLGLGICGRPSNGSCRAIGGDRPEWRTRRSGGAYEAGHPSGAVPKRPRSLRQRGHAHS